MEIIRGLEEAWAGIDSVFMALSDDQWTLPTPNTEWNIKDLAAHLGGLEAMFQGFPQPDPPEGWTTGHTGLHHLTDLGVAARRSWKIDQVLDEFHRASRAQLDNLRSLGEDDWQQQTLGPLGPTTMTNFADIRLGDLYVHLLVLRSALGLALRSTAEPTAELLVVDRAVRLTGWGAVKAAGLPNGTRIHLDLSGPGGTVADVVITDRRGSLVEPEAGTPERIEGPALAYLLEIAGRHEMAEAAGGLKVKGDAARALLAGYRLFG